MSDFRGLSTTDNAEPRRLLPKDRSWSAVLVAALVSNISLATNRQSSAKSRSYTFVFPAQEADYLHEVNSRLGLKIQIAVSNSPADELLVATSGRRMRHDFTVLSYSCPCIARESDSGAARLKERADGSMVQTWERGVIEEKSSPVGERGGKGRAAMENEFQLSRSRRNEDQFDAQVALSLSSHSCLALSYLKGKTPARQLNAGADFAMKPQR
jgi:hypothetical protein